MSTTASLESWALPRLSSILPLDTESLKQIIAYTAQLSPDASATHLGNLLGEESPGVLEFISGFNSRRPRVATSTSTASAAGQGASQKSGDKARNKREGNNGPKKGGGTLRASDSPRRPDGYGDVKSGYVKGDRDEEYMSPTPRGRTGLASSSAESSRAQSPAVGGKATKTPPSAQGPLVSEYMPNVRSKRAPKSSTTAARGSDSSPAPSAHKSSSSTPPTTTTNNIADLTSAIAALEVSTNPKDRKQQKCPCSGSIHPLFTPAPNCLACGKIICALEGLQPCSFCGTPLLSGAEVQDMIRELRAERGNEKMRAHNEGARPSSGGPAPPESRDSGGQNVDTSSLDAAKAHRDRLLAFQAQNAQRTRIVDEAADFDVPTVSSTQWMSPAQRALALKKQQRIVREMEERTKPEWEKKKMVMSLDVRTGKAVKTFERTDVPTTSHPGDEEEDEEEQLDTAEESRTGGGGTGGAFARNPLLKGAGLVRPVWKADKAVQERRREQKQTWRRVQDDNEDNEQWILDGGLHGYDEVDGDGVGHGY